MINFFIIFIINLTFFWVLFEKNKLTHSFILSLGVVPAIFSIELQFLYLLFENYSNNFYIYSFYLLSLFQIIYIFIVVKKISLNLNYKNLIYFLIPLIISLYVFFNIPKSFDIFDPISYGIIGETLFKTSSLADYPFVELSRTVFNFSWFAHPLGVPLIYSFCHLFNVSFLISFVSAYYYFLTALLIFYYLKNNQGIFIGTLGCVLAMTVPVMVYLGKDGFIGSFRFFFFTSLIIVLSEVKENKPLVSGFFTGLVLNTHLIGILAFPPSFFVFIKNKKLKFKNSIIHGITALIIGGFAYFNNLIKFNSFNTTTYMSKFYPKFANEFIQWHLFRKGIFNLNDVIFKGILGPFTGIGYFGLFFFIILIIFLINRKNILKSKLFYPTLWFFGIFLIFHLNPSLTNTFHMDSRYIATYIPIITLTVFTKNNKLWKNIVLTILVIASVTVGYEKAPWFYKQREVEFKPIVNYINKNVSKEDGILSRRFPFTQYYCKNHKTYSILDPKLATLHKVKNLDEFLKILKENNIKYILTSRDDGHPFENNTFIKDLLEIEGLATNVFKTKGNGFWLFKINKFKFDFNTRKFKKVFNFNVQCNYKLTTYLNKKNNTKFFINLTNKGILTTIPYKNSSSIISFSNGKPWVKNSAYINANKGVYKLILKGTSYTGKMKIHPFILVYDKSGKKLKSYSGFTFFNKENKSNIVKFKSNIPFKSSEFMTFPKETHKIIIGINYYSDKGVLLIENVKLLKAEKL